MCNVPDTHMRSDFSTSMSATGVRSIQSGAVAIISSAGGIKALIELLGALPRDFDLPIFVGQHLARQASELDAVLAYRTGRMVEWAQDGEVAFGPKVYLVPPGAELAVHSGRLTVTPLGPKSASWLAGADRLIESLSALCGDRTVAIVLSGALPAGINALRNVRARGGITMAQSSASSPFIDMPSAAIDFAKAELAMSPANMATALQVIAQQWRTADLTA